NLDAKLRNAMRVQLKHVQRQLKITTIYVTHDQVEAMTLADRIVIMDKGRIQQLGTPDEIYSNPNNTFVAGFIGSPPMNLIKGEVRGKRFSAPGVEVAGINLPDSRAVILGVRPEDAKVATGTAAHLKGQLYGLEPTGDQTFLSVRTDAMVVEVKADRDFRQPLDTSIAIELDPERLYFFDAESGQRIRLN
ncbi:ABC transporter ATP-binding protein, partial [Mesorhizobium sp. M4B.F.Ca.ET.088.02.2.1]